jgi:hypothetical protein
LPQSWDSLASSSRVEISLVMCNNNYIENGGDIAESKTVD